MINALQPNRQDGNAGKMDCIKKNGDTEINAGFSQDTQDCVNFSELYDKISECNKDALANDENGYDELPQEPQIENDQSNTDVTSTMDRQSLSLLTDIADGGQTIENENAAVASELIKDALSNVTSTFGLPDRDLDKLDMLEVNEGTVEQFAEIIYALNQIVSALDVSVNEGDVSLSDNISSGENLTNPESLQINDQTALSSALRVELFKLQMGVQLLGISAEVQSEVADLSQQVSISGMNQAIDPSSISMSAEQISKLFGKVLDSMNNDNTNQGTVDESGSMLTATSIDSQEKDEGAFKQFDTQTYRTLLKVNKTEESGENSKVDQSEKKDDLITMMNTDAAVIRDSTNDNRMSEFNIASEVEKIKMDVTGNQSVTHEKISSALRNMGEEAPVVEQITGKLTSVIRSGSNEVRIQLRPESLGEVSLRIKMEGDIVFTKIQVESQQVKQIVENNLQTLKDALADQNLSAGQIDVSVGNNDNGSGNFDWDLHRQHSGQDRAHDTAEEEVQDDQNSNTRASGIHTSDDTGKRYGNNSIEYYA